MRDPIYRNLRAKVQALLDRDAPTDYVLIEVEWDRKTKGYRHDPESKVVCIAREDLRGDYTVWRVGFVGTEPSSLSDGSYGRTLPQAAIEAVERVR